MHILDFCLLKNLVCIIEVFTSRCQFHYWLISEYINKSGDKGTRHTLVFMPKKDFDFVIILRIVTALKNLYKLTKILYALPLKIQSLNLT